jgi:phage baseplate assembly protein W
VVGAAPAAAVTTDPDRHLRDKILAVLFTSPGERVNLPYFGVGLRRRQFEGLSELMLGALRFQLVQGLRRDVGDDLVIEDLRIDLRPEAGEVIVAIDYRRSGERTLRGLEVVL